MNEETILLKLKVKPAFDYMVYKPVHRFFGKYPVWDLYEVHSSLLQQNLLSEYFISLHMEEFLDIDYVEKVMQVLENNEIDILFGNLSRTDLDPGTIGAILDAGTSREFDSYLRDTGVKDSNHWAYQNKLRLSVSGIFRLKHDPRNLFYLNFRKSLKPTRKGFSKMNRHVEDVYLIKKEFARRHNWFLAGHNLYFEDIHICDQKGVCELGKELKQITKFPLYFNRSKIYHLKHDRFYFHMMDEEFTAGLLNYESDDPILNTVKKAIVLYRSGQLDLNQALQYTRKNAERTGSQNLNYKYHMMYLRPGKRDQEDQH